MDCWVVFTITGDGINPELITRHLKIEPSRVVAPTENNDFKCLWQISSSLAGRETVEKHFLDILGRLLPVRDKLKKFLKDTKMDFYCSATKAAESSELLIIPPKILSMIGHLGANLEMDFKTDQRSFL